MKSVNYGLAIIAALMVWSMSAQASDPTKCGLGPKIVGDGFFGYSSNSSTSWITFEGATTSGTLGCDGLFAVNDTIRMQYIADSYDALRMEAAQGDGEHLVAFSRLMGCSTESQSEFNQLTQENYESLFTVEAKNEITILQDMKLHISQHENLSRQCLIDS